MKATPKESEQLQCYRALAQAYSDYAHSLPYGGSGPLTHWYLGEICEACSKLTEEDKAILRQEIKAEMERALEHISACANFRVQDGSPIT